MTHEHGAANLGTTLTAYGAATWAWVLLLSMMGGVASFFRKLREGSARPFNLAEFFGEITISSFAGICTFLLCEAADFSPLLSSALIAVSGHMGSRAIFLLEKVYAQRCMSGGMATRPPMSPVDPSPTAKKGDDDA